MAEAVTHPLLSLSDDEIIQKLGEMSFEQVLKFSLISERCKELVKSIQLNGEFMRVSIGTDIDVTIETTSLKRFQLTYYQEPDMYWGMGAYGRKKKLTEPQSVLVEVTNDINDDEDTTTELEGTDFTMKNWLEHLQIIFNYHNIDYIQFSEDSSQFDADDIKEVFGNTTDVLLGNTGCDVFNHMILQNFYSIEKLTFSSNSFSYSKAPKSILVQNFSELSISGEVDGTTSKVLDKLLLINSKEIIIKYDDFTPKKINKYIKLWQHGSNPSMEHLTIYYSDGREEDVEIFMKGIKHDVISENQRRKFKPVGGLYTVSGGMDIYRMDGTKATIQHRILEAFSFVEMYVWFDHCVVES